MEKIGFIGLGIMGTPMASHLLAAGYEVTTSGHHRAPPEALISAGLRCAASPREVALACDVVITMLPDTPQVEQVVLGPDGLAEGLARGKLVIDMSSIAPLETQRFANRVAALGCDYLDAPVSGGEIGAKAATLTIMVGGRLEAFERARPIFEMLGRNITRVGGSGMGQVAKIANQIIVALNIEAVAEALVFATKAGADPLAVRSTLMGGLATSRVLEVHGRRMIERDFDPGFRIALHRKDLALALEGAARLGVALPNTASTQQLFAACVANGLGMQDHSAIVTALERLAAHEVNAPPATTTAAA
jgi:2-hydroxy-3-oxopropionate reductase